MRQSRLRDDDDDVATTFAAADCASAMPTPPALEIDVLCDMGNSCLWSGLMDKGSHF